MKRSEVKSQQHAGIPAQRLLDGSLSCVAFLLARSNSSAALMVLYKFSQILSAEQEPEQEHDGNFWCFCLGSLDISCFPQNAPDFMGWTYTRRSPALIAFHACFCGWFWRLNFFFPLRSCTDFDLWISQLENETLYIDEDSSSGKAANRRWSCCWCGLEKPDRSGFITVGNISWCLKFLFSY